MSIVLDAMGSDDHPGPELLAAVQAAEQFKVSPGNLCHIHPFKPFDDVLLDPEIVSGFYGRLVHIAGYGGGFSGKMVEACLQSGNAGFLRPDQLREQFSLQVR